MQIIICMVAILIVVSPEMTRLYTCVFVNFIFASTDTSFRLLTAVERMALEHVDQKLIIRITLSVAPALLVT